MESSVRETHAVEERARDLGAKRAKRARARVAAEISARYPVNAISASASA